MIAIKTTDIFSATERGSTPRTPRPRTFVLESSTANSSWPNARPHRLRTVLPRLDFSFASYLLTVISIAATPKGMVGANRSCFAAEASQIERRPRVDRRVGVVGVALHVVVQDFLNADEGRTSSRRVRYLRQLSSPSPPPTSFLARSAGSAGDVVHCSSTRPMSMMVEAAAAATAPGTEKWLMLHKVLVKSFESINVIV
jgi:hypothetical protein